MNNPYEILGYDDPFGTFGIVATVFEAFKKCACAGVPGRKKSNEQYLSEALITINRAIKMHKAGEIFYPLKPWSTVQIEERIELYKSAFGGDIGLSAARELLFYATDSKLYHLSKARAMFAGD